MTVRVETPEPPLTAEGIFASKIIIPLFGGLVTAVVILLVMMELWNQNKNAKRTLAAKIFNDAVKNLGSKEHAKVLGAVYALNDLARTYPTYDYQRWAWKWLKYFVPYDKYGYSQTVLETLCGFVRAATYTDTYSWNLQEEIRNVSSTDTPNTCPQAPWSCPLVPQTSSCGTRATWARSSCVHSSPEKCKPKSRVHTTSLVVIQTIINRLFLHPDPQKLYVGGYKWWGRKRFINEDRFKVSLRGADLQNVDFFPVGQDRATIDWTDADLRHVNLSGAGFKNSTLVLKNASLRGANLSAVDLSEGKENKTPGADLSRANLKWAKMLGACLRGVTFSTETTVSKKTVKDLDMRGVHAIEENGFLGACEKHVKKGLASKNDTLRR